MSYQCDDDFIDDGEGCICPRCDGWQTVICHCGGDLCVCGNNGDADCPLCWGEGQVSDAVYSKYRLEEAENAKVWADIFANAAKGGSS